jgi:tol-pal system protein YbgF
MRNILVIGALVVLLMASLMQRPLEAKDKDEILQMKQELVVLQKQIRDLQESSDKNTGQLSGLISGLLTQAVDNISATRREVTETRQLVDRGLGDVVNSTGATTQQVSRLNERLNATDQRIERLQGQIEEIKRYFNPPAASTNCDNGDQQYGSAYSDYLRGNYALAIEQFRNYVRCFGQTDGAGNAQYFIGDSYYKQLDFKNAVPEFDKLLAEYPTNTKAATARFKKADSLLKTERNKEAGEELKLIIQNHPGTPEAKQAEELLRQLPPEPAAKPSKSRRFP